LAGQFLAAVAAVAADSGTPTKAVPDVSKLPPAATRPVDFARDIQPIFATHCLSCHGFEKQRSGLRLDDRERALRGGENFTPVIKPRQSVDSPLIHAVAGLLPEPNLAMPQKGTALSAEEIGLLRAWIDQGANWPVDPKAPKTGHWSLRPVERPPVPHAVSLPAGAVNPIDAFVDIQLREKQLAFNPPAARRTFIRRLYLVMHGLPPSPEAVERFAADNRPDAVERVVDEVLASPRYGERWARHWLDIVRYADSNGFETNRERKNAYPYRDYVIDSFNADKPYDRFVREQLAGDALGVDAGTGFLVAGAYDIVKSPDINLTLMQRQDELADIVNTTGTAFLGLTLGCARCHDHKFDPISQKDYYAVQAVFAGVNFADRPIRRALTEPEQAELADRRRELAGQEESLTRLKEKARTGPETAGAKAVRPAVNAKWNEETFTAVTATAVRFHILASSGGEPGIDELEVYDARGTNVALASEGTKPSASGTLPGYAIHKLEHLNDGIPGNNKSWISDTSGKGWVRLDFPAARSIQRIVWSRDRDGQFKDRVATDYRIEAALSSGEWVEIASSKGRESMSEEPDPKAFLQRLSPPDAQSAKDLLAAIPKTKARIAQLADGQSAWLGTFSQPKPTHRLYRGEPLQEREVVAPGAVTALGKLAMSVDEPEQQRRVRLAEWIASPANPLTARVMVNRVWHYLFGIGLVDTPSDFGANGGTPVNPALLDWMADELVQSGWSLKHLQKLILMSRTFGQSSAPRAEALAVDSEARRLWRFPPRRLEAEAIRDGILAVSGALDLRTGGPGFHLQKVEEDNVYRYFPKEDVGPEEFRRMVYLARIRQEQDSVFGPFDCPSGNQVTPRRTRSNTPLQALNLFNSRFVLQQAELLSRRLERDAGSSEGAQVRRAFQLMYGRDPDGYEREVSVKMIQAEGLEAFCRALFNTSESLFIF
jgi:mono/diheme cytochrome c family protein